MEKPEYNGRPIATVQALARMLGDTEMRIRKIAENADQLYRHRIIIKNGKPRDVYDATRQLKTLQETINKNILRRVTYPSYLHGGLKGKDYISDCRLHVKAKVAITEDISKFFPSIQRDDVKKIWQFFFHFAPEVAELLAKLTTREGVIPQGAKTSGFIANLLFWEEEPELVANFSEKNLRYSRFVDDITISSERFLKNEELTGILDAIICMFRQHGLHRNRNKNRIQSSNKPIEIHGIQVNSSRPTMPKKTRRKIRALVNRVEQISPEKMEYQQLQQVAGKVGLVARLHDREGTKLKQRLRALSAS
jgi:hypothetical protein